MVELSPITIIGGGLAGCEAAIQAARRGVPVRLYEMRPRVSTPAHRTDGLAELVCSNSLRSDEPTTAPGLLKEELRALGSAVASAADATRVPAGSALAVDREAFSRTLTEWIADELGIEVIREEVREIPQKGIVIVASGPLTSDPLSDNLAALFGRKNLAFYDAISPIVEADTLDASRLFRASRYGKGEDYLNAPMTREEYTAFYNALVSAEVVPERPFEKIPYFEGCMPIEVMAARGVDTLRFGPMKPVGLVDPRTDRRPYAVVQLRPESRSAALYNIVGFQTKLAYPEQRRVFRMIPGLEKTEFARLGSLHRNTFVCAPAILGETLQTKARGTLFLAGQITGVEGYVESAAMGWVAGVNAARLSLKEPLIVPPATTVIGSLVGHLTRSAPESFQPMNAAFGLLPSLLQPVSDREARRNALIARARADMARWQAEAGVLPRLLGARTRERA